MKRKVLLFGIMGIGFIGILIGFLYISKANRYQAEGTLTLKGLSAPARIIRDEKGMPYIYAENLMDLLRVQGYAMAQDRLFQMHLTRLFAEGRLTEIAGGKAKNMDIRMRTIGLHRNATKHAGLLDVPTKQMLQAFADGVNQYIATKKNQLQLELKLTGEVPEPWKIENSLAISYLMGWQSAANIKAEMISQMLIEKIGFDRFLEIFPKNTNPDDELATKTVSQKTIPKSDAFTILGPEKDRFLMEFISDSKSVLRMGSNGWVSGSGLSVGGKPIVASDPHLDARLLPGIFYPLGLISPDSRAVGVATPGVPGIIIGRNQYVANSITNGYGDAQDLFIETIDPENRNHYLEKGKSIPFKIISETLKIKDKDAETGFREENIEIRLTNRGPVISGVLKPLNSEQVVTMRWAPFETMEPSLRIDTLLTVKSVNDYQKMLKSFTIGHFNVTFADVEGNLGWQTTGRLPIRNFGNGTVPADANRHPNTWQGWIPYEKTPQQYGSERDWIGNANNNTVKKDYPYYYSSYFSPYYRYQRLKELMSQPGKKSVEDYWNYQRDDLNVLARKIAPIIATALKSDPKTDEMAQVLHNWDYHDRIDSVGTTIFQTIYRHLAKLTFEDELGTQLAETMLQTWYFWQERLETMIVEENSKWFDIISTTDKIETLPELIQIAALKAKTELTDKLGKNINGWTWGKAHQMVYTNPIRRSGPGKNWLGGGTHPMGGSGETLYRGLYDFNNPEDFKYSAAMRMVADLSDDEKVIAVMNGGVTGRTFHPNFKDQIKAYHNGSKLYWWFSDQKIKEHQQSELILTP